jgi:hypothetical protein
MTTKEVEARIERIKQETTKADERMKMLKGTPAENQIKAYVIGILFAYNVILGQEAKSLFDHESEGVE